MSQFGPSAELLACCLLTFCFEGLSRQSHFLSVIFARYNESPLGQTNRKEQASSPPLALGRARSLSESHCVGIVVVVVVIVIIFVVVVDSTRTPPPNPD